MSQPTPMESNTAKIGHVASLRARLWDAGFRPVPIYNHDSRSTPSPGKAPMGDEWTERARRNPPDAAILVPHPEALNTGILCDGLRAIDIDIDNPTIAAAVKSKALTRFGECPMRFRDSGPRVLLLYRAERGEPRKRSVAGTFGKVEVLGRGQQFVAFGIHHTGSELQWMPEAPSDISLASLPAISEEALTAFLVEVADLIGGKREAAYTDTARLRTSAHGLRADSLQVLTALHSIPNNGPADWEFWNRIGMAIWAATGGSEAGRAAFHGWSEDHPDYDPEETNRRWNHYSISPPVRIGAGTLFHMARQGEAAQREHQEQQEHAQERPSDNAEQPKEPPKQLLWTLSNGWAEADIPRRPWLVAGFILRGSITIVSGNPSTGKSLLMVAWAISLVTGIKFGKFKPKTPCRVILYNVEDDQDEQKRRFSAACRQFGITPYDLRDRLLLLGPEQVGTLLVVQRDGGILTNTAVMDALEDHTKYFNPDVQMLDPFVELHTAEENDNTLIRAVMARFRRSAHDQKMGQVILHHNRKGLNAPGDPDAIRGAGAIVGAGRIALTVSHMSTEEEAAFNLSKDSRKNFFRVDDAKKNYSKLEDTQWFERLEYQLDNDGGENEPADGVAAAVPWQPPVTHITPEILVQAERLVAKGSPFGPWSPRLGNEKRSFANALKSIGVSDHASQRKILDELLQSSGVVILPYRRPRHSAAEPSYGLRSQNGEPEEFDWLE